MTRSTVSGPLDWTEVLPTQSVCLQVPLALDDDYPECAFPFPRQGATGAPRNAE